MKKLLSLCAAASVAVLLTGCLSAPVMPPMGIIFTDYTSPLDYTQEGSKVSQKSGYSESMSIIGCVALGDASIQTAAEEGNLTVIHGADYQYFNVLGIYQRYTTIVRGE